MYRWHWRCSLSPLSTWRRGGVHCTAVPVGATLCPGPGQVGGGSSRHGCPQSVTHWQGRHNPEGSSFSFTVGFLLLSLLCSSLSVVAGRKMYLAAWLTDLQTPQQTLGLILKGPWKKKDCVLSECRAAEPLPTPGCSIQRAEWINENNILGDLRDQFTLKILSLTKGQSHKVNENGWEGTLMAKIL